ncbi:acetylserotonin O-methyltransferase [Nonomuraea gerenzanensis]|uniref:O-methyltransferase, family 2 n=2 Tax=Nonomuraea gerenzanensis TaxID=93944 RepID=A0A1M4EAN6_9ACTN|nr:acetylserotonin O-methyltransferase [Nonomuraea gerenzanensis]UBU18019.1 acetylserotonin O-methyltransferase [Nonomuraea gerenzanensis]SBO95824.1 O-methyltransferase, family 2 [Nonomuraea gerenzanensis]
MSEHRLWALAHLGTPMALRVAATLRIADRLAKGPSTGEDLAGAVGADPGALERLMRYLAARGVFGRDPSGAYTLTPLGEELREDHPAGMRAMLDLEGWEGRAELSFAHLLHSVRTGEAAFPHQFGHSFWDDLAADPARAAAFDARMAAEMPARAPAIVAGYDWGTLSHLVDVGGGNGSLLIALLTAFPTLHGTVLDQPETARTAQAALESAGLSERGRAVGGSFFDPLPAGHDGYLLSWILHDWSDDDARVILGRCAEAVRPGGSVFVVEDFGADGESPRTGMDLRMLVYYGGRERGIADLRPLAHDVGLEVASVHPAANLRIVRLVACS